MADKKAKHYDKWVVKVIFGRQNSKGGVPSSILEAARKLYSHTASESDRNLAYDYAWKIEGVKKSGASAIRGGISGLNRTLNKIGNYAMLASTIGQGGPAAFGAALGMVGNLSEEVQNLAKDKDFRRLVVAAATKVFNDPDEGKKIYHAVGRYGRLAGALGTAVVAGGASANFGADLGTAWQGGTNYQPMRLRLSEERLSRVRTLSSREKEIERLDTQSMLHRQKGIGTLPLYGEMFARIKDMRAGFHPGMIQMLKTKNELKKAGIPGIERDIRNTARERYLSKEYSNFLTRDIARKWSEIGGVPPTRAMAEGTAAEAAAMIARAKALLAEAHALAGSGQATRASAVSDEISREIGNRNRGVSQVWVDPGKSYKMQESARVANPIWMASTSSRAGARSFGD